MNRRVALMLVVGLIAAVLLVSVATAGEVHYWHASSASSDNRVAPLPVDTIPPPTTEAPGQPVGSVSRIPTWIAAVVQIIVILGILAALVALVVSGWRHRPRIRWRARQEDRDFDVLPDIARSMNADAADQRAALMRGSPRNAIVECWLRLEHVVAEAGLPRDPADTSTEFTARVLTSYAVDPTAILHLSALYREARFSTHAMDEGHRTAAVAALDALHDGLRVHLGDRDPVGQVNA